jgi:acetoacetyl-CoA synthetase
VIKPALEAQLYRQLAAVPELTGALVVEKETIHGNLIWLFVTLPEGHELDEALERRICLMLYELMGAAQLPRIFQLSSLPCTRNGRVMKEALSRFINQHELPNRAMMRDPQVLKEIARVTGLARRVDESWSRQGAFG